LLRAELKERTSFAAFIFTAPTKFGFAGAQNKLSQFDKSPMGRFFFRVMGALAEMERELIVERSRAGLADAHAEGRIGGTKSK